MPIRLNLLAEAQAAEDQRRRDPVKRAIWLGSVLVAAMLAWSGSIYFQALMLGRELSNVDAGVNDLNKHYQEVVANQTKTEDVKRRLASLQQLATNRFLNGNLLEALQRISVEDVQMMRLHVDQTYFFTDEVKGKTNSEGRVSLGRPPTMRETVSVTLEGKDASPTPGDRVNKFKDAVSTNTYFQAMLSKTNGVRLTFVSPPTALPDSKPFVLFTVEGRYPEQTR